MRHASMGEHARYKLQPGINVFSIKTPIADPEEVAQIEDSLVQEL